MALSAFLAIVSFLILQGTKNRCSIQEKRVIEQKVVLSCREEVMAQDFLSGVFETLPPCSMAQLIVIS